MSQDLTSEIELLRQRMQAQTYGLRTGLEQLEKAIDAEKAGALTHIRQVALRLEQSRGEIAEELESLKALLAGQPTVTVQPPPVETRTPPLEQRFTAPTWQKILEAAQ